MLWGQSLQFWQTVVFWLWSIAAVTGATAVAASFGSSIVSYYISDATETAAKIEIDKAKADAGRANERAGTANEAAGKANETAAELQVRARQLENEAASARERAATMEARVAELNLEIAKIKEPRKLSAWQLEMIRSACANYPGTKFDFAVTTGDPEAENFELILENLLKSAGWVHQSWTGYGTNRSRNGGPEFGEYTANNVIIFINGNKISEFGNQAQVLSNALDEAEIRNELRKFSWENTGENSNPLTQEGVHIVVGRKSL